MDFLAQLDERLLQLPQPKSRLAPYFEAHLLFQGIYHTPSPSPPSSPEPEQAIMATSDRAQPPPPPTTKRKFEAEDESYNIGVSRKRRRRTTPAANAAPSPPTTDDSLPSSQQCLRTSSEFSEIDSSHEPYVRLKHARLSTGAAPLPSTSSQPHPAQPSAASTKRRNFASSLGAPKSYTRKFSLRQPTSMMVGKYSLRWTATRARRGKG